MNIPDRYTLRHYGMMINDRARASPYVEALRRTVRPGDVVLDIGTGPGIFAFAACQFGASRVYAIEQDDAIEVARLCAKSIPGGDRIIWLRGFSSDIDLPERVDVIIGDLHGALPLYNQNIAVLIDARRRHLKLGGVMIPTRDVMYVVPASAADEYANIVSPWESNEYGIDLRAGRDFVANSWWRAKSEPANVENLLAMPAVWGSIDYTTTDSTNLDGVVKWVIARQGVLHGLYVWFDCCTVENVGFSNAPNLSETVHGRAFFPMLHPVAVREGDGLVVRMSATRIGGSYVFRWNTTVSDAAGTIKEEFKQSTFNNLPLSPEELRRAAADFVPTLSVEGRIDRAIMNGIAGNLSLGKIAAELMEQFPDQLAKHQDALNRAVALSARYGNERKAATC